MKRDKLYTINRWNQPAFIKDGANLFLGEPGYSSQLNINTEPSLKQPGITVVPGVSDDYYRGVAMNLLNLENNAFKLYGKSLVDNFGKEPLVKYNSPLLKKDPNVFFNKEATVGNGALGKGSPGTTSKGNAANTAAAAGAAASSALGSIDTGDPRGVYDYLDPVYHLANGRESAAGNAMSDAGVSLTKTGNPWLALAGAALKITGGLTNAAFGIKTDQKKLQTAQENIAQLRNYNGNRGSLDELVNPITAAPVGNVFEGGWFSGSKARNKQADLEDNMEDALSYAERSRRNNVNNIIKDQLNSFYANSSAYGGPIELYNNDGMGAIEYGFMNDYLANKKQEIAQKNKTAGMSFMPTFMQKGFAFGGDMQTNSADFPTGLIHVNAGLSHELNPYDGVQMGIDPEGVPNLVEEGEVVWNDYVFSNRIKLDEEAKKKFHFPKKKDITYAEAAKKLEKDVAERPNDPISKKGFNAQMEVLSNEQEGQKQEMEAEKAKAAFEALSPEEQMAVMQNAAQQEAIMQQAAQQQAMAEQQAVQQPSPEEMSMMQQQQMTGNSAANFGQEAPVMANGGHLFKKGGYKWSDFWKHTNEQSKIRGNSNDKYKIDTTFTGDVRALEQDPAYIAFTNYILNDATDEERLNYFKWIDDNTGRDRAYTSEKGELLDGWKEKYKVARNDGLYGIQHYTPELLIESKDEQPAAITPSSPRIFHAMDGDDYDGYIEGELDPALVGAETRRETLPNGDVVIYHGRVKTDEKKPKNFKPKYQNTMFGIEDAGPLVALGMQSMGIGKPDASRLFAAAAGAGNFTTANWMPRGDFAKYKPTDPWRYTMPILASSEGTDRNIMDTSGGNSGTARAGLLANAYNTTNALGQAALQGDDVNFNRYMKTKAHDAEVHRSNQGEYGQTSRFNASAFNDAARAAAQMRLQAASQKMAADADWYGSIYGNVGNIFRNFGAHRRDNAQHNMIADMAANGIFKFLTPDSYIARNYLTWENPNAEGGKINKKKKRGLTF